MAIHDSTEYSNSYAGVVDYPLGGRSKRAFDFLAALIALLLLAPLLILLSALIYVLDGGPVMIRHTRIGSRGAKFGCFKFRSMVTNGDEVLRAHLAANPAALEEWSKTRKLSDDPRVTPLGRILRKTSLDELPQLFNIVAGEMSFVGPRPIVEEEIHRYGPAFQDYARARPGLTGHWQVSGRSDIAYDTRVALDQEYVANWSFGRDIAIILMTIPVVIKARGVY